MDTTEDYEPGCPSVVQCEEEIRKVRSSSDIPEITVKIKLSWRQE